MHLAKTQSGTPTPAPAADEKQRLFRDRDMAVAQRPVVSQLLDRARMQRYLAGLGELGLVNRQTANFRSASTSFRFTALETRRPVDASKPNMVRKADVRETQTKGGNHHEAAI